MYTWGSVATLGTTKGLTGNTYTNDNGEVDVVHLVANQTCNPVVSEQYFSPVHACTCNM